MSIFNRKQQTKAKARPKRAWLFRLLALITILMGMSLASPQVEAGGPTYPIQELDDGSVVVEGAIFVKAEAGFKVPAGFAGYEWEEINRIDLSPRSEDPRLPMIARSNPRQESILYQISPAANTQLPQTVAEYNGLTDQLEENSPSPGFCAGVNHVIGSPNIGAGAFSAGSAVGLSNVNDADFEEQSAFNQFQPFRSPDGGENVDMVVFDAFREDAHTYWSQVNFNVFSEVTPTINLVSDPPLPDMPKHGEIIISQIRYLAPAATILPVHVLNDNLLGNTATLIKGLTQVIARKDNNPNRKMVVNMSLGLTASPLNDRCDIQTMNELLEKVENRGIVVVAAAGNDGRTLNLPIGNPPPGDEVIELPIHVRVKTQYPANVKSVIGIAASNSAGLPTSYSNNGDVMAPGGEIGLCGSDSNCLKNHSIIGRIPTDGDDQYIAWEGTSFAAPVVSALAANLLSCNPDLTLDRVQVFIDPNRNSTNDPINVQNALAAAGCISIDPPPDPFDVRLLCDVSSTFCDAIVLGGSGNNQFTWQADGGATIINGSGSRATIDPGRCPGNPSVIVEVTDSSGNSDTEERSLECDYRGIGGPSPIP